MKGLKKFTLCLSIVFAFMVLISTAVYADTVFKIEAPESCSTGDTIKVKVILSSDETLQDSDVFLVYDENYFQFIDSEDGEHDAGAGAVRFRGDFSADSYSDEWTAEFKALKSGPAEFTISDKWVQNVNNEVVDSSAEDCTVNIAAGEGGSSDAVVTDTGISAEISFTLHLTEPDSVPSCFSETTANLYGSTVKVWILNPKMLQDVDYTADADAFYAIYGYTKDEEDAAWYLYDTEEKTFQRLVMLQDVKVKATKEPKADSANAGSDSSIFEKLTGVMIGVFVVLVIAIIVFNVIFSRMEKKSRMQKMEERRKASREELMRKRAAERQAMLRSQQEVKPDKRIDNESQNMQRPE